MGQTEKSWENRVIIIGVGLIGGSVAAAVRQRSPQTEVIGIGRSAARLQLAEDTGLLTAWATELSRELLASRCLVVICLPVDMIAAAVCETAHLAGPEVRLLLRRSENRKHLRHLSRAPDENRAAGCSRRVDCRFSRSRRSVRGHSKSQRVAKNYADRGKLPERGNVDCSMVDEF